MPVDPLVFVLRFAEALLAAAPTLLLGFLTAGALQALVAPAALRRLFGAGGWSGPLRAWCFGTLLPVCALGVLPILRALRRSGVPRATLLVFALAAPLLNPFSLLYGLTLMQPWVLAVFVAASMAVVLGAGLLAGSARPEEAEPEPDLADPEPRRRTGGARLVGTGVAAARAATGPAAADVLVGLLGVGLLGASLPHGTLMYSMVYQDPRAPLTMAAVAPLVFITPERAMMLVGEMYEHSSAPGAAFVLLVLGAGLNLGTLAWVARTEGVRTLLRWALGTLGLTLALGYAINATCYLPGSEQGHTHIFDNFSRPSGPLTPARVATLLAGSARPASVIALGGVAVLALAGAFLRVRPPRVVPAVPNETAAAGLPQEATGFGNRSLPASWLAASALAVAAGLAVAGTYVYFPSPEEMFEDIRIVRGDALSAVQTRSREAALGHVAHWEQMMDRLPIGAILRRGVLDQESRAATQALCECLEELHAALKQGRLDEAREQVRAVQQAHDRCRESYLGGLARSS